MRPYMQILVTFVLSLVLWGQSPSGVCEELGLSLPERFSLRVPRATPGTQEYSVFDKWWIYPLKNMLCIYMYIFVHLFVVSTCGDQRTT